MKLKKPWAKHGVVHRVTSNFFRYNGWPSVARDERGVLYAVASCFRAWHVCPMGKTAMFISYDNGETWTKPIVINDSYHDDRDAGILYMGNGRLLVTWFTDCPEDLNEENNLNMMNTMVPEAIRGVTRGMLESYNYLPRDKAKGGSYVIISEDYGVTWCEPIRVPISAPHGPSLCKDGSLIYLGKALYDENGNTTYNDGDICAYKSTDHGYTWERISTLSIPEGLNIGDFHEPHAIELSNGKIIGMLRSHNGTPSLYQTESLDGGKTWSEIHQTGFYGYPAHLLEHSSGAVVCVYGKRYAPCGEYAAVSYDKGVTWEDEYLVSPSKNGDMGYPASVELSDGSILTVYYQIYNDDDFPSILCTRWRIKCKG